MAAVALFLLAVAGYALLVHTSPQYHWTQIDTAVYRDGGIAVRSQPAMLYALKLGPAKLPFIYTPFAALVFAVGSGASFATWQAGLAVLTIGLLPVVAYLSLGLAGRPAGLARAAAAFAIAAVSLWLEPVAMTLFFGQINLVLLALVVGDLALPDRIKGGGDQAHAVDLHSVPAVHAASKGRGGQRADLRGHGGTWVRAAAARLRGLLGRAVRPAGQQIPSAQPVP